MDWEATDRAPADGFYSRAVVGDLSPDPMTPLTATAGVGAAVARGWRDALAETGVELADGEFPVARFGSHLYLDTAAALAVGECATGADPVALARQYLGERSDVPRRHTLRRGVADGARLEAWTRGVLAGEFPGGNGASGQLAGQHTDRGDTADRPAAELVSRIRTAGGALAAAAHLLARAELAAAVTGELLTRIAEDAGHPSRTGELVAGGQATEVAETVWAVARQVARSESLGQYWDRGLSVAARQVAGGRSTEARQVRRSLRAVADRYSYAGPAEWELSSETWETDPRLLFGLIDVLRRAGDDARPATRARHRAAVAAESVARVRASLRRSPKSAELFDAALGASRGWLRAREHARRLVSGVHHEQRLAARELGRRAVESGLLDSLDQVFMLRAGELDRFATEPTELAEQLRMRSYDHRALARYQPPFTSVGPPPPVVRWSARDRSGVPAGRPRGPVCGTPASPGVGAGMARLPRNPADLRDLRPGDILVLPSAGPHWVPLVVAAAGVVVDGGAALSDVALACRDLGIPSVVATVDATRRISRGDLVRVDGWAGAVRPTTGAAAAWPTAAPTAKSAALSGGRPPPDEQRLA